MMPLADFQKWAATLDPTRYGGVFVDDSSLALVALPLGSDPDPPTLEIGGLPGDEHGCDHEADDVLFCPTRCNHPRCRTLIHLADPYYATPCGTYCSEHMPMHVAICSLCRSEFAGDFEEDAED